MPAAPDLVLIINGDLSDPTDRRVRSLTDFSSVGLPDLICGENYACQIYLIDNAGAYKAQSGDATYSPRLSIGTPGTVPNAVEIAPGGFTAIANGWSFNLDLTSAALLALFAAAVTAIQTLELEFQLMGPGVAPQPVRKWYRRTVRILPRVATTIP